MSRKPQTIRLIAVISLLALSLTLSGCVYLRLLQFKNQLKSFDKNVYVDASSNLTFGFHNPIVKDSDFVFISGVSPEKIETDPHSPTVEVWTWSFEKKRARPSDRPYKMNFKTRFKEGLLTEMEIDETFVQLVGTDYIQSLFRRMGNAKINTIRRSMSMELDKNSIRKTPLPSLSEIIDVMGEPTKIAKQQSPSHSRCEYEFNFLNPENGKKAAQFRLFFTGDLQNPEKTITGIKVSGKGR